MAPGTVGTDDTRWKHQVMNHALVAADAGGDAVEQTGGGGCPPLRAYVLVPDAVSQMSHPTSRIA